LLRIADEDLQLQLVIVDDCSKDASFAVASELSRRFPAVTVVKHEQNRGKGRQYGPASRTPWATWCDTGCGS